MKTQNKLMKLIRNTSGTSLALMIVMISVIVITGGALMVMTVAYYKMNIAYAASEDLYYRTDRLSRVVLSKLEEEIKTVLENVKVYNDTNDAIDQDTLDDIYNTFGPLPTGGSGLITDTETEINDKLMTAIQGTQGDMVAKGLYDVAFKLRINRMSGTNVLGTDVLSVFTTDPQVLDSEVFKKDKIDIVKRDLKDTSNDKEGEWLQSVLADPSNPPDYLGVSLGIDPYYPVEYTIETENPKANLTKKLDVTFQLSSSSFEASDFVKTGDAKAASALENSILGQALLTAKDLIISGSNGRVVINGDVYAFGTLPSQAVLGQTVIPESSYQGITVNGTGKTVEITGQAATRGYLRLSADNIVFKALKNAADTTQKTGNVICDTLLVDKKDFTGASSNLSTRNIEIGRNLYTYDDVRVNGTKAFVYVDGYYYGLYDGQTDKVNRSSALILNNTSSKLVINNTAFIGGKAYLSNVTNDDTGTTYVFKTAESATLGDNYKIYSYRINPDVPPSSLDSVISSDTAYKPVPTDYKTWKISDGTNDSFSELLCRFSTEPNYDQAKELLLRHFYYYARKSYSDPITYNYSIERGATPAGIWLNGSKNYGQGIINANGKSYWAEGTPPWGVGTPPADSGFAAVGASDIYDTSYYTSTISPIRDYVYNQVSLVKQYTEDMIRDATIDINSSSYTKDAEYIDKNGILATPNSLISSSSTPYYWYLTRTNSNITIGDTGTPTISASYINGAKGIIFTEGSVTITNLNSNFTFNGTIIALGGITINTPRNVTINYTGLIDPSDPNSLTYKDDILQNLFNGDSSESSEIRKFFAPGNIPEEVSTKDVYRGAEQNVRIIDKKLVK